MNNYIDNKSNNNRNDKIITLKIIIYINSCSKI